MKDVCISRRNLRKKRVGFEEVRDLRGYGEIAEYGLERSVYGGKRNLENERKIHIIEWEILGGKKLYDLRKWDLSEGSKMRNLNYERRVRFEKVIFLGKKR